MLVGLLSSCLPLWMAIAMMLVMTMAAAARHTRITANNEADEHVHIKVHMPNILRKHLHYHKVLKHQQQQKHHHQHHLPPLRSHSHQQQLHNAHTQHGHPVYYTTEAQQQKQQQLFTRQPPIDFELLMQMQAPADGDDAGDGDGMPTALVGQQPAVNSGSGLFDREEERLLRSALAAGKPLNAQLLQQLFTTDMLTAWQEATNGGGGRGGALAGPDGINVPDTDELLAELAAEHGSARAMPATVGMTAAAVMRKRPATNKKHRNNTNYKGGNSNKNKAQHKRKKYAHQQQPGQYYRNYAHTPTIINMPLSSSSEELEDARPEPFEEDEDEEDMNDDWQDLSYAANAVPPPVTTTFGIGDLSDGVAVISNEQQHHQHQQHHHNHHHQQPIIVTPSTAQQTPFDYQQFYATAFTTSKANDGQHRHHHHNHILQPPPSPQQQQQQAIAAAASTMPTTSARLNWKHFATQSTQPQQQQQQQPYAEPIVLPALHIAAPSQFVGLDGKDVSGELSGGSGGYKKHKNRLKRKRNRRPQQKPQ